MSWILTWIGDIFNFNKSDKSKSNLLKSADDDSINKISDIESSNIKITKWKPNDDINRAYNTYTLELANLKKDKQNLKNLEDRVLYLKSDMEKLELSTDVSDIIQLNSIKLELANIESKITVVICIGVKLLLFVDFVPPVVPFVAE